LPRWLLTGATLLLLGACGGQQISLGVTNTPEAAGSGSASTVPNVLLNAHPPPGPTTRSPAALGGGGAAARTDVFCGDVAQQLTLLPSILSDAGTPGKLPSIIQQARAANARILRDAPAAIRGDVQTLIGFSNRLFDDVSANPPKVQDVTAIVADPKYRAAAANVGRYASLHCGAVIPPTTGP
jgi:hypothetical protein